jgi:elongation factor P
MIVTDLKTGTIFKEDEKPFLVLKYEHVKVSRGSANVRLKARNLITGQVLDKSYLSTAKVEDADVIRKNTQYLYKDNAYVFMDPDTFEQIYITKDTLGDDVAKFLKEGESVQILYFEGEPVSVDLPITMVFEVKYTEPGHKGNTVTNVMKDATLETGAVIKVPGFIKIGDRVKINTQNQQYSSKA